MKETHYRNLERAYQSARINRIHFPDTLLSISEGKAQIRWVAHKNLHHGMHALHGSAYFKLLDDACFFAANSLVQDFFVLTTSFDIDFLRPVVEGTLRADAAVIHASRNLWVARGELVDSKGRALATGTGRFVKSRHALPEF